MFAHLPVLNTPTSPNITWRSKMDLMAPQGAASPLVEDRCSRVTLIAFRAIQSKRRDLGEMRIFTLVTSR